jgi:Ca2+-binding EF-hand superfamily protein
LFRQLHLTIMAAIQRNTLPEVALALSDAEIEELRDAFAVFDKDDSGSITGTSLFALPFLLVSRFPSGAGHSLRFSFFLPHTLSLAHRVSHRPTCAAEELGLMLKRITPSVVSNISDDHLSKLVQKFDRNGTTPPRISPHTLTDTVLDKTLTRLLSSFPPGDGTIDFNEFLEMMCQAERGNEDELHDAFAIFDKDGDGTITAVELQSIMSALGEDVDMDTCKLMIASVDLDGNGTIDVDEFRKMMRDGVELDAKIAQ